jgi:hypothetical protein
MKRSNFRGLAWTAVVFCHVALRVGGQWAKDVSSFEVEGDVLVLTGDNIDEALAKYDPLLVNFYSPK